MRWLFRLLVLFLIVGLPAAAAVKMIDRRPLIPPAGEINMNDLKRARTLAERYDPRRMPVERLTTVRATGAELNTLLKGAFGKIRRVAGRVDVSHFGVLAGVTVELPLPENPLGRYLNIRTLIAPSDHGLDIARLAIGSLEIPPSALRPALRFGFDKLVGPGKGEDILDSIKSVKLTGHTVTVALQPPPDLVEEVKRQVRTHAIVSDPRRVRAYYGVVERTVDSLPRYGDISFIEIMRPVFKLARERSATRDPIRENEAAMLAIAIYFGDSRFEQFVGTVRSEEQKKDHRPIGHFRLDGRFDFVQHFTVSMGLALTGGDFAADIIGELKEASDSQGGSGFSFTDIGADRMGVRFARYALSNHVAAVKVQQILSEAHDERAFFPRFADLPEGMSEAAFRHRYRDVNSPAYKRVIAEINRRIAGTRVFR